MKVVFASTPEQENKIKTLIEYFYTDIFPKFFPDKEILKFEELDLLNLSDLSHLSGTLKESYQIISSLEILITLIESDTLNQKNYQEMFINNAKILNELGIAFPFSFKQFIGRNDISIQSGSIYAKAANSWLV